MFPLVQKVFLDRLRLTRVIAENDVGNGADEVVQFVTIYLLIYFWSNSKQNKINFLNVHLKQVTLNHLSFRSGSILGQGAISPMPQTLALPPPNVT